MVFTDDMAVDPVGVLQDVLEFLGLDLLDKDKSKVSVVNGRGGLNGRR